MRVTVLWLPSMSFFLFFVLRFYPQPILVSNKGSWDVLGPLRHRMAVVDNASELGVVVPVWDQRVCSNKKGDPTTQIL